MIGLASNDLAEGVSADDFPPPPPKDEMEEPGVRASDVDVPRYDDENMDVDEYHRVDSDGYEDENNDASGVESVTSDDPFLPEPTALGVLAELTSDESKYEDYAVVDVQPPPPPFPPPSSPSQSELADSESDLMDTMGMPEPPPLSFKESTGGINSTLPTYGSGYRLPVSELGGSESGAKIPTEDGRVVSEDFSQSESLDSGHITPTPPPLASPEDGSIPTSAISLYDETSPMYWLHAAMQHIETDGIDREGLYRIPGAKDAVSKLVQLINSGDGPIDFSGYGIMTVCSAVSKCVSPAVETSAELASLSLAVRSVSSVRDADEICDKFSF